MKLKSALQLLAFVCMVTVSCKKSSDYQGDYGHLHQAKTFSSDVVVKWLNMQLELMRVPLAPGASSQAADRVFAYSGIATYEAVVNGMPAYQSLSGQLKDFPEMPVTEQGKSYYWPASANAALAYINKKLFAAASSDNISKMTKLEDSLTAIFSKDADAGTLQRSVEYGRAVATKVYDWAATDGSANANPPYVPPAGVGLWVPTAQTPPVLPYASQRRILVSGDDQGATVDPPPPYSEDPSSAFYAMVKEVYDKSLVLTADQIAMAIYHRDAPGYPGGGHFCSILSQALVMANPNLDIAALAYVKMGISFHDAIIHCFVQKYTINQVRPITYIQNVMGYKSWTPVIPTPNHPEFPSAHGTGSSAVAVALTDVLGDNFSFTDHTYDYLGLAPRNFTSFTQMAKEMADSRVFAGIHYVPSCEKGAIQGEKIATNVLRILKFKKL